MLEKCIFDLAGRPVVRRISCCTHRITGRATSITWAASESAIKAEIVAFGRGLRSQIACGHPTPKRMLDAIERDLLKMITHSPMSTAKRVWLIDALRKARRY